MVYPLGVHPEIGSLRLHIWPTIFRQAAPGVSGIHNHAWYIASRVITGNYSDMRYEVKDEDILQADEPLPPNYLRVIKPQYVAGQPDGLSTDGTVVSLSEAGEVQAKAGESHTIAPHEFHLPTIPMARLAVTLVLDSPSFGYPPSILIGGAKAPESFQSPRVSVERYEAEAAREQVLASIGW